METAHPGKGKGPGGDRGERKSGGEFKKKERNLNIRERWVSNVASLEDGYLHFMLLLCVLVFTKASGFQKC